VVKATTELSRQELEILLAQLSREVTLDRKTHRYQTPIGIVPSVTTILKQLDKPALMFWASKVQSEACEAEAMAWSQAPESERGDLLRRLQGVRQAHKDFSRRAADMGKEGHALAEYEFRRKLGLDARKPELEHPREASMICAAIMEWAKANEVEPVSIEGSCWSREHGFCGTYDLLAFVQRVLTVVDFKSNDKSRVYRESYLQNHAYRGALGEHGIVAAGLVLAVPRDGQGEINPTPIPWRDADWKAFLGLRAVHEWSEMMG
jgi:hypothetical protein